MTWAGFNVTPNAKRAGGKIHAARFCIHCKEGALIDFFLKYFT